jgi:hypothetical protein
MTILEQKIFSEKMASLSYRARLGKAGLALDNFLYSEAFRHGNSDLKEFFYFVHWKLMTAEVNPN